MIEGDEVYFESAVPLRPSVEAFLSAFLIPAMRTGRSVRTEDAVCGVWAGHAAEAQAIARRYWGFGGGDVIAPRTSLTPESDATGVFFTGGVDSFHSLLTNRDVVRALVFVQGFDIPLTDTDRLEAASRLVETVAAACNLRVLTLRTNLRRHPVFRAANWGEYTHGAALGAVAQLLASHLGQVLIASSDIPPPHGSSEELDRCWSSGAVTVRDDSSHVSRFRKVAAIAGDPLVHEHLRVCWENRSSALNCGVCEKCLRTQVEFVAAGMLDRLTCFEDIDLPARIGALWSIPHQVAGQWADAERALDDTPVRAAVRALRRRTRRHAVGERVRGVLGAIRGGVGRVFGMSREH
jgi:hypothetical protein